MTEDPQEARPRFASDKPDRLTTSRRLRAAMTYPEQKLWRRLRKLDAHIRRQAPLGRYIVDFVCHRACLVIEVDGGIHQREDVALRDVERDDWLRSQGYRVLRISNHDAVERLDETVELIRAALGEAPPSPDPAGGALPPHPPTPSPSRGRGEDVMSPPSQPFPHQGGRALWRARDQWVREDEN